MEETLSKIRDLKLPKSGNELYLPSIRRRLPQIYKSLLQIPATYSQEVNTDRYLPSNYDRIGTDLAISKLESGFKSSEVERQRSRRELDTFDITKATMSSEDQILKISLFKNTAKRRQLMRDSAKHMKRKAIDLKEVEKIPEPQKIQPEHYGPNPLIRSYSNVIYKFFHSKLERTDFNVFREYQRVEQQRIDEEPIDMVWGLLYHQFQSVYSDSEIGLSELVYNTTCYFEQLFLDRIEKESPIDSIRSFVKDLIAERDFDIIDVDPQGEPGWAIAFYLLRAGFLKELQAFVKHPFFPKKDQDYFVDYLANGFILEDERAISNISDNLCGPMDIFKRAIYAIFIKQHCEIEKIQQMSLEDYLWLKLKITHTFIEEFPHRNYQILTLEHLRSMIIGNTNAKTNRLAHSLALLSTLSYGETVKFLYESKDYAVQAVHLAIALDSYSILPTLSNSDKMFEEHEGLIHVNYEQMISQHLALNPMLPPNDALAYISFIRAEELVAKQVTELVSYTDNYQIVLNNESYIFGMRFREALGPSVYIQCVESVAKHAARQRDPEAVACYYLIEKYTKIIEIWMGEIKHEIRPLIMQWNDMINRKTNFKDTRASWTPYHYASKKYPYYYKKLHEKGVFSQHPELDKASQILDTILTFYSALTNGKLYWGLNAVDHIMPLKIEKRKFELIEEIKKMHPLVKDELPELILSLLQVLDIISDKENVKDTVTSLVALFVEVSDIVRALPKTEQKVSEIESLIMEFRVKYYSL